VFVEYQLVAARLPVAWVIIEQRRYQRLVTGCPRSCGSELASHLLFSNASRITGEWYETGDKISRTIAFCEHWLGEGQGEGSVSRL
jgi:hypothetical protein